MISYNDQKCPFGTYKCCLIEGVQHKLGALKKWLGCSVAVHGVEAYSDSTSFHLEVYCRCAPPSLLGLGCFWQRRMQMASTSRLLVGEDAG